MSSDPFATQHTPLTRREISVQLDEESARELKRAFEEGDSRLTRWFAPLTLKGVELETGKSSMDESELLGVLSPGTARIIGRFFKRSVEFTDYQRREILAGRGERLVYGNYVVQDLCGKGGEASVYKAFDVVSERVEAIKVFDLEALAGDREYLRSRFERGLAASARLDDPNVVKMLSYQVEPELILLAMEFVVGPDLGTKAGVEASHTPGSAPFDVSERDAVEWIKQAARGLQHGHERRVIHRDVKPSNLLLDEQENMVRVADWGLARIDDDRTCITFGGLGTCYWKSPEQALRPDRVDHRTDIYSLGCTLYSILTGTVMYTGETSVMVELAHVEQPTPSINATRPISPQVEEVYQKMVAKNAGDRYPTMTAVIEALNNCQVPAAANS